jgi:hypothetical protein
MTTCPMSWGRSRMGSCLSLRLAWRTTNGKIATSPVRRQHGAWHVPSEGSTGLARNALALGHAR